VDNDVLRNPYGRLWTQYCESVIADADAVTVSNQVLGDRYGGTVIPHARDERLFDPARYDRDRVRASFGFEPDEHIILFGGTPRRHKGVVDVARALHQIGDPRLQLCLIGPPSTTSSAPPWSPTRRTSGSSPTSPSTSCPRCCRRPTWCASSRTSTAR
jgi:glycosyltransferase involved in cell wall biosynthesis